MSRVGKSDQRARMFSQYEELYQMYWIQSASATQGICTTYHAAKPGCPMMAQKPCLFSIPHFGLLLLDASPSSQGDENVVDNPCA